jgi:hypothetical protein
MLFLFGSLAVHFTAFLHSIFFVSFETHFGLDHILDFEISSQPVHVLFNRVFDD